MSDVLIPGFIYLLVEREFVRSGETIVKVGRTTDVVRRLSQYPKGSKLLFCMYCDTLVATESELLLLLDKAFKRRPDVGRESFEGAINSIIAFVSGYATAKLVGGLPARPAALVGRDGDVGDVKEAPRDPDVASDADVALTPEAGERDAETAAWPGDGLLDEPGTSSVPTAVLAPPRPPKETVCPDAAVVRFVEEHKATLDNARELSASLYDRLLTFCDAMNWKVPVRHEAFSKLLVQIYGASSVVVRDGLVVHRYVQMPRLVPVPVEAEVASTTSYVRRFLALTEGDAEADVGCGQLLYTRRVEGVDTSIKSLQAAFVEFMNHPSRRAVRTDERINKAAMQQAGFEVADVHICKACGCHAKRCCTAFSPSRRSRGLAAAGLAVVRGMKPHA